MNKFKKFFSSINPTVYAVVIFLIVLTASLLSAKAVQAKGFYLELGKTIINSNQTTIGAGYRTDNYGIAYENTGQGSTKIGRQDVKRIYSIYRIIKPSWQILGGEFKSVIGMAYTPDQKLVGKSNFRLELILEYGDTLEFFARHYSSAGLWENNTGIDSLGIRLLLD